MTEFDYDLFVIGAGSGGVRAARIASQHGAKVAIAEEYRYGGTCVIRGCVPKKILVYASRFRDDFEDAPGFGWQVEGTRFDWSRLIANKDKEIDRLEAAYKGNLERAGVETFGERAVFEGAHTVRLTTSGRRITADKILVATGGTANLDPDLEGVEHVITSNEAFGLKELPKRVVVAGGGYIAVEFAGIFAGLGAETTLIYRGPKILRGFDEDLRDGLMQALPERGIRIITEQVFTRIEKTAGGLKGTISSGEVLDAEQIMFAIGRSPRVVDHMGIPTAVFSTPEIGTCGMTEALARELHGDVDIYKARFRPMRNTMSGRDERTLMKLIVSPKDQKILGCHILGPDAGEIIQVVGITMKMGATKADFDATMALHPSAAEELVTMREKWTG
jgi:glutathione reductase (NADPH)